MEKIVFPDGSSFVSHTLCFQTSPFSIIKKTLKIHGQCHWFANVKSHTAIKRKIKRKLFQFPAIKFTVSPQLERFFSMKVVSWFAKRPKTSLGKNYVQKYGTAENCHFSPSRCVFPSSPPQSLVQTDSNKAKNKRNNVFFVNTWSRLKKYWGQNRMVYLKDVIIRSWNVFSFEGMIIQSLQQKFFTQNKTKKNEENYIPVWVVILSHTPRALFAIIK